LAPIPWGWVAAGASDRITLAWDYPATLLGYPAGLIRWRTPVGDDDHQWSLEAYGVSFTKGLDQTRNKEFAVEYRGGQYWAHLYTSHHLHDSLWLHAYAGATHTDYFRFHSNQTIQFPDKLYQDAWCPDYGVDLEIIANSWLKIHANAGYGNTFFIVDQVLFKTFAALTFQMAPFSKNTVGILRQMRIELSSLYVRIPDVQYEEKLILPIFPYVYWQWGGTLKPRLNLAKS
jgi:hypothetical protein